MLVGLRSAVETVAGAEGLAPAGAPVQQGAAASAQPAAQAMDVRQGSDTGDREPHYAYTWAVILAAVSSTVSCALLLAALLALGLGRLCRPVRRRTAGEASAGSRPAKEPPNGSGGGCVPPSMLLRCRPALGTCADATDRDRWAHALISVLVA